MAKAINISEEEKKQIVNTYQFYKASGAKISVLDLAAQFKHNHYKIVEILREYGVLKVKEEEIIKTEHKIWQAEKIVVNGKEYYDVSSAPRPDGFLEFGIEAVGTENRAIPRMEKRTAKTMEPVKRKTRSQFWGGSMTEEEIYKSYKNAKYPKEQIKILSELTLKSKEEIQEIILWQQTLRAKKKHESEKKAEEECAQRSLIYKRLDELDALITAYTNEYQALAHKLKEGIV